MTSGEKAGTDPEPTTIDGEPNPKRRRLDEPKEPKRPVSERRELVPHLAAPLNDQINRVISGYVRPMVDNYNRFRATDPAARSTPLTVPAQERSRKIAAQIHDTMTTVKRRREINEEVAGPTQPGPSQLTHDGQSEAVKSGVRSYVADGGNRVLVHPLGNRKGGASNVPGEVFALPPGVKVGDQTLQLLGHLSQIFMNKVNDMEYQSMLVNDRVLVASNAQAKIAQFRDEVLKTFLADAARDVVGVDAPSDKLRAYQAGAVASALTMDPTSTAGLSRQQTDGAAMLGEYALGHHIDHGSRASLQSVLNLLQAQAAAALTMLGPFDPTAAAQQLTQAPVHSVILVHPQTATGWHAEQALAMTLINANWQLGASVSGTKLPCFCCWLTLNLLPQYGFPITFTQRPGLYWDTQTLPGLTHVAKSLGIVTISELLDCFGLAQRYTEDGFRQFMTALTEQTTLTVDINTDDVTKSGPRRLTQDQSQRSFNFGRSDPNPTALSGVFPAAAPGSPVGHYDTPPGSPGGVFDQSENDRYNREMAEYQKARKAYDEQQAAARDEEEEEEESSD